MFRAEGGSWVYLLYYQFLFIEFIKVSMFQKMSWKSCSMAAGKLLFIQCMLDSTGIYIRSGRNTRPDPDTSGNPTRLNAKFLMSRIIVYSILIMPFSLWARSSWRLSSENCCPVNRLATTRHIPFNKAENIEEFIQPATGEPDPDPLLISAYVHDAWPDTDFLCSFHT